MSEEIAISVENVSKDFRLPHEKTKSIKGAVLGLFGTKSRTVEVQHALHDISFNVKQGEFFGIVGRNGSGKSTLLKILASIYQPTKGSVAVKGRLVPFIELGVGFNPELTGRENVYLNGALLGFTKHEMDEQYDEIVEFAELDDFMDQKLKNYSSGMQVRLAFSLAIRADADILLIDEVLAVGDALFQRKCLDYFQDLKRRKKVVVFVSHDMNAVQQYCDRALLINDSRIVDIGSPDSIAIQYYDIFAKAAQEEAGAQKAPGKDETERGGTGEITYDKVAVRIDPDAKNPITITAQCTAHKTVENPIFGFRMENAAGQHIMGTNTRIERYKTRTYKKGEQLTVSWTFENLLSDGRYFLDMSIHTQDGLTNYDRWLGATEFKVVKPQTTPYPVSPNFIMDISAA